MKTTSTMLIKLTPEGMKKLEEDIAAAEAEISDEYINELYEKAACAGEEDLYINKDRTMLN